MCFTFSAIENTPDFLIHRANFLISENHPRLVDWPHRFLTTGGKGAASDQRKQRTTRHRPFVNGD